MLTCIPCNNHVFYPHLNNGVLYKLMFANLYVKWHILMVSLLSTVDTEVIMIVGKASCEATRRSDVK